MYIDFIKDDLLAAFPAVRHDWSIHLVELLDHILSFYDRQVSECTLVCSLVGCCFGGGVVVVAVVGGGGGVVVVVVVIVAASSCFHLTTTTKAKTNPTN